MLSVYGNTDEYALENGTGLAENTGDLQVVKGNTRQLRLIQD